MPMFIGTLSLDLLLGDVHSLKQKRAVIKPILADLARRDAVAVAEVEHLDLHRRCGIGVVTLAVSYGRVVEVLDACERMVAGRPEIELVSTRTRVRSDEDDD